MNAGGAASAAAAAPLVSSSTDSDTRALDAPGASDRRIDPGTLLRGPVAGQLLRLALPILVVLAMQTLVSIAETYFVGFLGTDAITGVTLVFPLLMLMTMMSSGGIGGGVSSAIARAVGAGRMEDADALVTHAALVAIVLGGGFSAAALAGGRAMYSALGGEGAALANALLYSSFVFGAAIPIWLANLLASALRGAGNMKVPATVTAVGALMTLGLSPLLIFGVGPVPGLGVAGAGVAMVVYYALASAVLVAYLRSPRAPVRLVGVRIQWRLLRDILGVGTLSAIGTLLANITVVLTTGLVGGFGSATIAGYGIASRLDYLLIPLLFALGTASVTMVGINVGAGQRPRARRIAWTAGLISAAATGAIGCLAAMFPEQWVGLFSRDIDVIGAGADYLHRVAPFYALYGFGMALYFASQGAGKMLWPVIAGIARLLVVTLGGWYWIAVLGGSLTGLFWIVATSMVVFGLVLTAGFGTDRTWGRGASAHRP
ncbi:MAG: MATE family efflux transporter [Proteobacteria bacterium]|nr:MATE family efflux transporter [Pseudomonadota bacterium]